MDASTAETITPNPSIADNVVVAGCGGGGGECEVVGQKRRRRQEENEEKREEKEGPENNITGNPVLLKKQKLEKNHDDDDDDADAEMKAASNAEKENEKERKNDEEEEEEEEDVVPSSHNIFECEEGGECVLCKNYFENVRKTHIVDSCQDMECMECSHIVCPYRDLLHFHHDGCPSCTSAEDVQKLLKIGQSQKKAKQTPPPQETKKKPIYLIHQIVHESQSPLSIFKVTKEQMPPKMLLRLKKYNHISFQERQKTYTKIDDWLNKCLPSSACWSDYTIGASLCNDDTEHIAGAFYIYNM